MISPELYQAVADRDLDRVKALIKDKDILEAEDDLAQTALFVGVSHGNPAIVRELLAAGANPKHLDDEGWTARMHALADGKRLIASILESAAA